MDDVDWGGGDSQFFYQTALWQYYQQSHLVAKWEDLEKENEGFFSTKYFFHTVLSHPALLHL
jgi:hypothetical protein